MTGPPLGIIRQFSRAVFADRRIGDDVMRMTMAGMSINQASPSGPENVIAAVRG